MAHTVRDVMIGGPEYVNDSDTVLAAARRLAELSVGALPIRGPDGRLEGILTDRDIVVNVVVTGKDPAVTTVADIADQPEVVVIDADASIDAALVAMAGHRVRRLPVVNGGDLVGVLSQADLARALNDARAAKLMEAISLEP